MAAWRRAIEFSLGDEDTAKLRSIAQSRTEPASRVERARILLAYRDLVEGFFAKLTRSVLRRIRVASKQELKDRLIAAVDYFNRDPVVHTWTFKLDKAA
jgi:hypothetical protein